MELIRNFKQLNRKDVIIAGGKGASLGEMTKAGISVPPGFVILSTAFEKFLEETDLNVEIDSILGSVNHKDIHTVESASEKIQSLILEAGTPEDIGKEIQKFFKKLDTKFVAVRSSATAEDSASAAWAGQLESYLNTTEENLLENIKKCWASLFTPRAIFYRFEKDLHRQKISVAVVVQKMVESEKSGVAFSVHPITQDRNQLIIEAGFGLGEAIVSGKITPDSYVVEKNPRRIIDKNIQVQNRGLFRSAKDGNEWLDISKIQGERQVLSDNEILELSELILHIENRYGFPCDIEWAFEEGRFYIVQSRPITTLLPANTTSSLADKFITALSGQELFPPIHNSTLFVQTSGWNIEKYYGQYYSDKTPFPLLITAKKDEGIMFIPATKAKKLSEEVFKLFWRDEAILTKRLGKYEKQTQVIDAIYGKIITPHFIEKENFSDLVPYLENIKGASWEMNTLAFFSVYFDKEMCAQLLSEVGSKISQRQLDIIWEKGSVPISDSFEKRRERYLFDLLGQSRSWSEIGIECQYFGANYNKISSPEEVEKELREKFSRFENTEARTKFLTEEKLKKEINISEYNKWLSALSPEEDKLVRYLQAIIELRDARKDYLAKFLVVVFRITQKLFKEVNLDEELIYFYMFDEIVKGKDYLLQNKAVLEKRHSGYSVLVNYDGTLEVESEMFEDTKIRLEKFFLGQQKKETDEKCIKGQTGSPGKIQGIVKVIMNIDKEGVKFNEGDVLVTGMTRPEFIQLMKKAVAVITDEGGITCHAAIVSRELKIPCVIGTKVATRLLKDGDLVEVDANIGIIRIIK